VSHHAKQIDRPFLAFAAAEATERPRRIRIDNGAPPLPLPQRAADHNEIVRCVCQSYLVSPDELASNDRHKNVAEARKVACWLLRTLTARSFPEIGRLMSKDHTSVMHAVKSCSRRRETDAEFRRFTDELAAAVKARLVIT
jgi:chromosomal replication initiation ATPase DnaA